MCCYSFQLWYNIFTIFFASGSAAFKWKLRHHWLKCSGKHHVTVVIDTPGLWVCTPLNPQSPWVCMVGLCFSGLDNKCTLYPLSLEEDPATKKRVIATHTSYLSCCKFTHSDQQVQSQTWHRTKHVAWWAVRGLISDGLMQERRNSVANALELRLFCTNPSTFLSSQCKSLTHVEIRPL